MDGIAYGERLLLAASHTPYRVYGSEAHAELTHRVRFGRFQWARMIEDKVYHLMLF